ncbi:response regulator transcription factor [Plebeiibacterium sediminum]|uniref:Response regulator transcription factor n=1 Tax=Plebeiibacterium sediminum TaxID=2992112 RepID=A0AAE3M635_9BACT|nr:response regulator transcription factor [Plebeiobacterium sediminum]MCW3787300.1 response regulator transcription factor [Plebeiobacterium sediminum]
MLKIAIVDDHAVLRFGLNKLLSSIDGVEVVIEANDGKEFLDLINNNIPDIAFIDLNMPVMNGIETVKVLKAKYNKVKAIILSMNDNEQDFKLLNEMGVDGYLLKDADFDEIERAINTVKGGGKYFSQELLLKFLQSGHSASNSIELTKREYEVLECLCQGLSAKESAERLNISPRTIEKHRTELFAKTGTNSSIALVVYAVKNNLINL